MTLNNNQERIQKYNCSDDKFIFDKNKKKIELNENINDQSLSSFDLSGYFSKNSDGSNDCPITIFKISKVYDYINRVEVPIETYNNAFFMDPTKGKLLMRNSTIPVYNYRVYVDVFNT